MNDIIKSQFDTFLNDENLNNDYIFTDVMNLSLMVVNHHNIKKIDISNTKLQKLLFYIDIAFYTKYKKRLINEDFVKTKLGPILTSVKGFGNSGFNHINPHSNFYNKYITEFDSNNKMIFKTKAIQVQDVINFFPKEICFIIDIVCDSYAFYESWDMINKFNIDDKNNNFETKIDKDNYIFKTKPSTIYIYDSLIKYYNNELRILG